MTRVLTNTDSVIWEEPSAGIVEAHVGKAFRLFPTKAAAEASITPGWGTTVTGIRTLGYSAPFDGGGADYVYVASDPGHGGVLNLGGGGTQWAVLASKPIKPAMFGNNWTDIKTYIETRAGTGDWSGGFLQNPDVLDLDGRDHTLSAAVHIAVGVHLKNGRIIFEESALLGDYGLCLGVNAASGTNYTQIVQDVDLEVGTLTANQPAALLYIPRTVGPRLINVNANAGDGAYRTRYGAYVGRYRAWSGDVLGGRYYGGECCLRIGRENDHTGMHIFPAVCDHGRVANLIVCNPAGCFIGGRIEHSDGKSNLVITSQTNGSANVGHQIVISSGYMFNMANESAGSGWDADATGILIGHDVPGTTGWDGAGLITSAAADNVKIENNYIVSNEIPTIIKANVVTGLTVENNKWFALGRIDVSGVSGSFSNGETITGGTSGAKAVVRTVEGTILWLQSADEKSFSSGETLTGGTSGATATAVTTNYKKPYLLEASGACATSRVINNRNQNTGSTFPAISSTATNRILVTAGSGVFTPVLKGDSADGTYSVTTDEGRWTIADGVAHIQGHIDWTGASGAAGNMNITLPTWIDRYADNRAAAAIHTGNFTTEVSGLYLSATEEFIRLYQPNTTTRIAAAGVPAAGNVHFSVHIPLDFAD